MANQGPTKQDKQAAQTSQGEQPQGGGFRLDDLSYDMVTVLYEKSKALEAFDKYQQDAQGDQEVRQLFEQMRQADEQFVQQLRDQLGQRFGQQGRQGKPSGQSSAGGQSGSKGSKQSFYSKEDVVD